MADSPGENCMAHPEPILFTEAAATKVRELILEEANPELKLRVYISGGGC
ncbi:MAG: iron-sulfur cluster insertion protein ErpA, partial [Wenzhouxiangella sp.]